MKKAGTWSNEVTSGPLTVENLQSLRYTADGMTDAVYRTGLLLPPWFPSDAGFQHFLFGLHADYEGRRYRRGKNRCQHCGAPLSAGWSNDVEYVGRRLQAAQEFARAGVDIPENNQ